MRNLIFDDIGDHFVQFPSLTHNKPKATADKCQLSSATEGLWQSLAGEKKMIFFLN